MLDKLNLKLIKNNQFIYTIILAGSLAGEGAFAAPLVNSMLDPGDGICDLTECTLREAIADSVSGDEITFDVSLNGSTIMLSSILDISGIITISGLDISIAAATAEPVAIHVGDPGSDVTLNGLTILDSGISNFAQTVRLENVTVAVNSGSAIANSSGGVMVISDSSISGGNTRIGGGIINISGDLTIIDSTIHSNNAENGAGFFQSDSTGPASTTMTNVTISDNTATVSGGGMWVEGGDVTVTNSTITGNHADSDSGGVAINNLNIVTLKNSIVAGNTALTATSEDCSAIVRQAPVSNGNNVFGDNTGCPVGDPSDIVEPNIANVLMPLADNGGMTMTHALTAGSTAINNGDASICINIANDQRGAVRSVGAACDSGSFEFGEPIIALSPESLDFGLVDVGEQVMMIINVSNTGNGPLNISDIALPTGEFSFSAEATPITLDFDETTDVEVIFTPILGGMMTELLSFTSDSSVNGIMTADLVGTGVSEEIDPQQQIQEILDFFDQSIADGSLVGAGPRKRWIKRAKRAKALRNMIEAAGDLIDFDITASCKLLKNAYKRTDGKRRPPEFVKGPAAATLATMIDNVRIDMECDN